MSIIIVPSNMFLYTKNGILGREIHVDVIEGASLWIEQLNLKIGVFDKNAIFTSTEYYIPELYYWYKYDCVFSYNATQINLISSNCLYYRKISINGIERQFPGRFPQYIDHQTNPRITYDIRVYLSKFGHHMIQHLLFLLNLYNPNDKIEMTGLTEAFTPIIEMYVCHLDKHIDDSSKDSIIRLITTLNFKALEKLVTPENADCIMENLLKYIEIIDVIQQLPLTLCTNLIMTSNKNTNRYIFRDTLTKIARKNNRIDLCNIMIPSPLRKHT